MQNHQSNATSSDLRGFLSGLLIGGLTSTAIVLLTAPQSGKKTRAQIQQKTLELRDQAAEAADEARQRTEIAVRQARLKARQVKRSAEATVKDWQHRSQTLLEEQKDRVDSVLEALQPGAKDARG